MTVEDVMLVATAYDQYGFDTGLQCCDRVLLEYFQKVCKGRDERPSDLDLAIDAFLLADKAHLEEAKQKGIEYFKYVLDSGNYYYGRYMFGKSHMERLAPIIARENLLAGTTAEWTDEAILSPLFPTLFVRTMSLYLLRSQIDSAVPRIKLSGSNSEADGIFKLRYREYAWEYTCNRIVNWGEEVMKMKICWSSGDCKDWVIVGYTEAGGDEEILWKCPNSSNSWIPPTDHWVPVYRLAKTKPKVEYCSDYSRA
jgi:hypothetical protein